MSMNNEIEITQKDIYQYRSGIFIAAGFLLQLFGSSLELAQYPIWATLQPFVVITGVVCSLIACMLLAKSKKLNQFFMLLGLFNLVGYIIIGILPAKCEQAATNEELSSSIQRAKLGGLVLFCSFAVGQAGPIIAQPYGAKALLFSVPAMLVLYGAMAFFIAKGKNWARIIATVIIALGVTFMALMFTEAKPIFLTIGIAQALLWVCFLYLVYSKPGSICFSSQAQAS